MFFSSFFYFILIDVWKSWKHGRMCFYGFVPGQGSHQCTDVRPLTHQNGKGRTKFISRGALKLSGYRIWRKIRKKIYKKYVFLLYVQTCCSWLTEILANQEACHFLFAVGDICNRGVHTVTTCNVCTIFSGWSGVGGGGGGGDGAQLTNCKVW